MQTVSVVRYIKCCFPGYANAMLWFARTQSVTTSPVGTNGRRSVPLRVLSGGNAAAGGCNGCSSETHDSDRRDRMERLAQELATRVGLAKRVLTESAGSGAVERVPDELAPAIRLEEELPDPPVY